MDIGGYIKKAIIANRSHIEISILDVVTDTDQMKMAKNPQPLDKMINQSFAKQAPKSKKKEFYADIILCNSSNQVLLLKRSLMNGFAPNAWGLPGGHVDKGEEAKDAAIRELQEETGLVINDALFVAEKDSNKANIKYFWATISDPETIILNYTEHQNYMWAGKHTWMDMNLLLDLNENLHKIMLINNEDILPLEL